MTLVKISSPPLELESLPVDAGAVDPETLIDDVEVRFCEDVCRVAVITFVIGIGEFTCLLYTSDAADE